MPPVAIWRITSYLPSRAAGRRVPLAGGSEDMKTPREERTTFRKQFRANAIPALVAGRAEGSQRAGRPGERKGVWTLEVIWTLEVMSAFPVRMASGRQPDYNTRTSPTLPPR